MKKREYEKIISAISENALPHIYKAVDSESIHEESLSVVSFEKVAGILLEQLESNGVGIKSTVEGDNIPYHLKEREEKTVTVGELRKIMAGLDDNAELEIRDEATEETYAIHEIKAMAFPDCHTEKFNGETGFWLQFTTNIQGQTGCYVIDKVNKK